MFNYQNDDFIFNNFKNINNNSVSLYSPEEGFNKGNLFEDLYDEYKNYKPEILKPTNEKEALFLDLSRYSFAAHELNLYLDLHPEDESMLALFNDYREKTNKLIKEYETKYGPITISSDEMNSSFSWENNNWPWEGEK